MSGQIGTAYVRVLVDTDEMKRGLDKSKSSIASWGKSLAVAGAAGAAIGIATDFLVDSVKAAQESEKVNANLKRTVEATGKSYEKYGEQIDGAINKTSSLAALDDEDLAQSFTKLVGTTKDVTQATEGMNLAADIARARNVSLETATKAVEKAYLGSDAALKKFGVAVPKVSSHLEAAKAQVEALKVAHDGKLSPALKYSTDQLIKQAKEADKNATSQNALAAAQKKFAGAAEAYGKTSAGAQEKFGIAMENVKEQLGTALLPVVTKFFNAVTIGLEWWMKNWPKISETIAEGYRIVKPILDSLVTQIKFIATIVADVARLVNAIVHGDWDAAWKALKTLAVDYIKGIITVIENLPIVKAIRGFVDLALGAIRGAVDEVKRAAEKVGHAVVDGVTAPLDFAAKLGGKILGAIRDAGTWVISHFGTPFSGVVSKITGAVTAVLDFGADLGRKILDGIEAAGRWLLSKIGPGTFTGLAKAIKDAVLSQIADIGDWIQRQLEKIPGYSIVKRAGGLGKYLPGLPGGLSAPAAAAGGGGGGGSAGVSSRSATAQYGTLGSGVDPALRLPGLGSKLPAIVAPAFDVRVFIGDQELKTMIRTEVVTSNTRVARTLLAGAR